MIGIIRVYDADQSSPQRRLPIFSCRPFSKLRLLLPYVLIYMTGHAFQAFLTRTDLEALLATVREHLQPDGYFAFETRNPRLAALATGHPTEEIWEPFQDNTGRIVRSSGTDWYDHVPQLQHYTVYRRWIDEQSKEVTTTARIALRYVFPQEMETLETNADRVTTVHH